MEKSLAQAGFEAYNNAGPVEKRNKTFDGRDVPPFAELGESVQEKWTAAADAIAAEALRHFGRFQLGQKVRLGGTDTVGQIVRIVLIHGSPTTYAVTPEAGGETVEKTVFELFPV